MNASAARSNGRHHHSVGCRKTFKGRRHLTRRLDCRAKAGRSGSTQGGKLAPPVSNSKEPGGSKKKDGATPPDSSTPTAAESTSQSAPPETPAPATPLRFFSPESFWNRSIPAGATIDPESAQMIAALSTEIAHLKAAKLSPWINTTDYGVPIYTVSAEQQTSKVLLSGDSAPALQAAWEAVPIPSHAQPSEGADGTMVIWQPETDKLWEFWRISDQSGSWQAQWGGAMDEVSANEGVYSTAAWPGAKPWWGSSASSLSIAGGVITLEDLRDGEINHALAVAVPQVRAGYFASPAMRSDGTSHSAVALPEGAHLRLNPSLDIASLNLPPLTRMIAEAAQQYGIIVRDRAASLHFFAQDPVTEATNPFLGPEGYFEDETPAQLLERFPWNQLEVLEMQLQESSG